MYFIASSFGLFRHRRTANEPEDRPNILRPTASVGGRKIHPLATHPIEPAFERIGDDRGDNGAETRHAIRRRPRPMLPGGAALISARGEVRLEHLEVVRVAHQAEDVAARVDY